MNRVCEVLGIIKPVIQVPMAWIPSSDLVAAVADNVRLHPAQEL